MFERVVFDHAQRALSSETHYPAKTVVPAVTEPADRELMDSSKQGDSAAFGVLVRRHQRRIYKVALHLLRNAGEAEDVVQDTFVRAYVALPRFDGRSQPYTWFYRIAVNLSLNRLRSRRRHPKVTEDDDARLESLLLDTDPKAAPEGAAGDRQLGVALARAVDSLSETLRTTLILVAMDGLSHSEVAAILGCPEGTVAWRVHEARKKIRNLLVERGLFEENEL